MTQSLLDIRETVLAHDGEVGESGWTLHTGELRSYTNAFGRSSLTSFTVYRDMMWRLLGFDAGQDCLELGDRAWRELVSQMSDFRWFRYRDQQVGSTLGESA